MDYKVLHQVFRGTNCHLVPMEERDTTFIVKWRNDPLNAGAFFGRQVFTEEAHSRWLRERNPECEANWVILNEREMPIGAVSLYNIDWVAKRAEFGRLIIGNASDRRRGYADKASRMVLMLGCIAGVETIFLQVKAGNAGAYNLYKKIGFQDSSVSEEIVMMTRSVVGLDYQIDAF